MAVTNLRAPVACFASFFEEETIWAAAGVLPGWVERCGIPCALYIDWKNVYVREVSIPSTLLLLMKDRCVVLLLCCDHVVHDPASLCAVAVIAFGVPILAFMRRK
jgi:hypothetical protein